MARPAARADDQVIETWECAFPGSVWVWVYDRRNDEYRKAQVSQRSGSRKLHITRDDRKYNQELIPDENRSLDPFTNGHLRLLGAANRDESLDVRNHYSDEDLAAMFEQREPGVFEAAMEALTSEVVLRRLQSLADEHATVAQVEVLRRIMEERWPIGGTQRTVREMYDAGERIGAARI